MYMVLSFQNPSKGDLIFNSSWKIKIPNLKNPWIKGQSFPIWDHFSLHLVKSPLCLLECFKSVVTRWGQRNLKFMYHIHCLFKSIHERRKGTVVSMRREDWKYKSSTCTWVSRAWCLDSPGISFFWFWSGSLPTVSRPRGQGWGTVANSLAFWNTTAKAVGESA